MPLPGFEPESSDRKSEMIVRTTPQGLYYLTTLYAAGLDIATPNLTQPSEHNSLPYQTTHNSTIKHRTIPYKYYFNLANSSLSSINLVLMFLFFRSMLFDLIKIINSFIKLICGIPLDLC